MPDIINAVIVFSLSIFLIAVGIRQILRHRRIIKNGLPAKGFVYEMNGTKPVIRFAAKGETWITAQHDMGGLYEKGETLRVIYNPANPKEFFVQSIRTRSLPYILIVAGTLASTFGILALLHIIPWHT